MRNGRINLTLVAFRIAAWLVPKLPDVVVGRAAVVAGWTAWAFGRAARGAVRANLRVVMERDPTQSELRAVFVTAAQNYADLFYLPRRFDDDLLGRVDVEGLENLATALAGGRGALVASLHLGNIEVVGRAASLHGHEITLPVERLDPPELLDLMLRLRRQAGFRCAPVGESAFGAIRDALRRNEVVGIGVDRITLGEGELVEFCGRTTRMPIAAALLALRTGAPLLPYATRRLPGQRFRLQIGAPIAVTRTINPRSDARDVTERLLAALEVYLRGYPTQWVVFRSVWNAECPA